MGLSVADYAETDRPGVVARAIAWVRERIAYARTAAELDKLSARQLDDIGLTASDIATVRERARFF